MEYRDFEWKKPHVIAYKITFKDDIELVVSHTIMKLKRTRRGCEAQLKNIEAYSKETLDELCEKFSKDRDKLESSLKDF